MKKLILLAGVFALIMSSCTQDLPVAEENILQEVSFTSASELKSDMFLCDTQDPDYAILTLHENGIFYETITVNVFYVNDIMYTQAIKLAPGTYTLEDMRLYATGAEIGADDGGTSVDDLLVNAAPHVGGTYANLVSSPLPAPVNVSAFAKTEVPISVLCYTVGTHLNFGFTWLRIEENTVKNKYFFGDFCTKFFDQYRDNTTSLYYNTGMALVDMPAIFKMHLYYDSNDDGSFEQAELLEDGSGDVDTDPTAPQGELVAVYGNYDVTKPFNGLREALAVPYPDMDGDGDFFKVDIFIYVKVGNAFEYVPFGSWYWEDDSETMYSEYSVSAGFSGPFGTDNNGDSPDEGVYDFVLGNCNVADADFVFAPYMNLPSSGIELDLVYTAGDNNAYSYWTAEFTNITAGYDVTSLDPLTEKAWGVYCIDHETTANMSTGTTTYSNVGLFSTLDISGLPDYVEGQNIPWADVNWLINNLDQFEDITWKEIQVALWVIESDYLKTPAQVNDVGADLTKVGLIVTAANGNDSFVPMPGQYAAVILHLAFDEYQAIFTIVDP